MPPVIQPAPAEVLIVTSPRRPILFVSSPESGLFNSLFAIATELSRRGVPDLWFATDEKRRADIEGIDGDSPVRFASLGEVVPEFSSPTWDDETYRRVTQPSRWKAHRALVEHTFKPHLRVPKYRALDAVVDEVEPALMIIDSVSFFGVEVAITKKIPFMLSVPFLPSNLFMTSLRSNFPSAHSGLSLHMSFAQRMANRWFKIRKVAMFFKPSMLKTLGAFNQVRKDLGIAPEAAKMTARTDLAEQILCFSVTGLEYPFPFPDNMRLLGAIVPPLPEAPDDGGLSRWLDARDSVVYMGFGTVTRLNAEQVRSLVEVVRRLDGRHDVLWKLPKEQQQFLPPDGELPGNLRIESWVPSQLDVLAHPNVKVFFTHGGGNGFHEGIYFGKPLVVRPLWIDCYDQAVRGMDSGVSLTLDRPQTFDVDDVLDKLTRVLNEASFHERARHFAQVQREAGGLNAAAELILGSPALK
jgi:polyene glycosyltransferase